MGVASVSAVAAWAVRAPLNPRKEHGRQRPCNDAVKVCFTFAALMLHDERASNLEGRRNVLLGKSRDLLGARLQVVTGLALKGREPAKRASGFAGCVDGAFAHERLTAETTGLHDR
jgi:hypothetical protein